MLERYIPPKELPEDAKCRYCGQLLKSHGVHGMCLVCPGDYIVVHDKTTTIMNPEVFAREFVEIENIPYANILISVLSEIGTRNTNEQIVLIDKYIGDAEESNRQERCARLS